MGFLHTPWAIQDMNVGLPRQAATIPLRGMADSLPESLRSIGRPVAKLDFMKRPLDAWCFFTANPLLPTSLASHPNLHGLFRYGYKQGPYHVQNGRRSSKEMIGCALPGQKGGIGHWLAREVLQIDPDALGNGVGRSNIPDVRRTGMCQVKAALLGHQADMQCRTAKTAAFPCKAIEAVRLEEF